MFSSIFGILLTFYAISIANGLEPSNPGFLFPPKANSSDVSVILNFLKNGQLADGDIGPIEFPIAIIPTLFPDLEASDPMALDDKDLRFRSPILRGTHKYWSSRMVGHAGLGETLWLTLVEGEDSIRMKYELDLPSLTLEGSYQSDLEILSGLVYFSGQGFYSTTFTNTTITIEAKMTSTDAPSIILSDLEFAFRFRKLDMVAQNSLINCVEPIWEELGYEFTLIVETYVPFLSFRLLSPILTPMLNRMLSDCRLEEILLEGDLSCLKQESETSMSIMQQSLMEKFTSLVNDLPMQKAGDTVSPCVVPGPSNDQPKEEDPIETTTTSKGAIAVSTIIALALPVLLAFHKL